MLVVPDTRFSIKPRLIRPPEKISAATISVMTEANTLPIPCQNVVKSGKTFLTLRWCTATKIIAMKKEMSIATVVESSTWNMPRYSEKMTRIRIGTNGRMAKMPGTSGRFASSTFSVL